MEAMIPYLAAVLIQLMWAGLYLLSKAAFNSGLSPFVFSFYRQVIASIILIPIAILKERRKNTEFSWRFFCDIFVLALGITGMLDLYATGLKLTSSTSVASATNTIPVFTFLWAFLFRMETVDLRTMPGMIKVGGVLSSVGGIIALALYKGPALKISHLHHNSNKNGLHDPHQSKHWVLGTSLVFICYVVMSLWLVLQGRFLKKRPSTLLLMTLQSNFSAIQTFVVALAFERDFSCWQLKLDVGLVTILYSGIVVSSLSYYLQAWCICKKGPVFGAMFTPLGLVFTAAISPFIFGEPITLGSVVGGILLVIGLYCVLWAKRKEEATDKKITAEKSQHLEEKDVVIHVVTDKDQISSEE